MRTANDMFFVKTNDVQISDKSEEHQWNVQGCTFREFVTSCLAVYFCVLVARRMCVRWGGGGGGGGAFGLRIENELLLCVCQPYLAYVLANV